MGSWVLGVSGSSLGGGGGGRGGVQGLGFLRRSFLAVGALGSDLGLVSKSRANSDKPLSLNPKP